MRKKREDSYYEEIKSSLLKQSEELREKDRELWVEINKIDRVLDKRAREKRICNVWDTFTVEMKQEYRKILKELTGKLPKDIK